MPAETIVAVSGVVIAVAALLVAVWQGVVARRHNRISVTPHLRLDSFMGKLPLSIVLSNRGVGPAIVKDIAIYSHERVDGTALQQLNEA
jgi:hypothetical protein